MLAPSPVKSYPLFESVFATFGDWLTKRRKIRESRRQIVHCDSNEVARMARELGVGPSELRRMTQYGPDAADLLPVRMAALHLDADALECSMPGVMRDLQRLCSTCVSKKRCQRDLEHDPENPVWRQYCPNKGTLAALQDGAALDRRKAEIGESW